MPLNRQLIGQSRRSPEVYEVSREKLRDYAVAIGDPSPAFRDESAAHASGQPTIIAPPTFATMMWFRMGAWPMRDEPDLHRRADPIFLMGSQRVIHHRPIRLGDRLTFSTLITNIRMARPHELMELQHSLATEAGEPVCTIVDVMISRHTAEPDCVDTNLALTTP